MDVLPEEIISKIFSYLSLSDKLALSESCRKLYFLTLSRAFLKSLIANISYCDDFTAETRQYLHCSVKNVDLDSIEMKINVNIENEGHTVLNSVEKFKIENVTFHRSNVITQIIIQMRHLSELHFEGIYLKGGTSISGCLTLPSLKTLNFFYCTNKLLHLFIKVDTLKVFKVCLIPHANDDICKRNFKLVTDILDNNRNTLRKLNLYEVNFDDRFLIEAANVKFKKLSKLSMSFNSYLSPNSTGFNKFVGQQSKTLENFKIRTFDAIHEQQLQSIINLCVNIRNLNLIICSHCSYDRLSDFKSLQKLEKLRIQPRNFCAVGNLSYEKFIEEKVMGHRMDNLKFVDFAMLKLSTQLINKIISSFPNLEKLHLSSVSTLDSQHADLLRSQLIRLKEIKINGKLH
jgi:F-box-like